MISYKKGAFVHIVDSNPREWEGQFQRIEGLPSRQYVEIWLEYIPNEREVATLRDIFKSTETIVHGPFIHMSFVSHLETLREISRKRCNAAIEVASSIGAKVITFHAGTYPIFDTHEVALERLCNTFSSFTRLNNPVVCLENMPVSGGTNKECLGRLGDLRCLKSMMPDVHFTLDIGHCLQNGDDFEAFLLEQNPYIEDVHLHDGNLGGRSHLRLGMGTLNLKGLLGVFKSLPFTKYVSLETISFEDTTASWQTWLDAESMS